MGKKGKSIQVINHSHKMVKCLKIKLHKFCLKLKYNPKFNANKNKTQYKMKINLNVPSNRNKKNNKKNVNYSRQLQSVNRNNIKNQERKE